MGGLNSFNVKEIMCSSLVQLQDDHLVIIKDFWKFVVILIPIMLATFGLVAILQGYWTKAYEKERTSNDEISSPGGKRLHARATAS